MAIIRCQGLTGIECEVAFDGEEEFIIGQAIAHAKGTHKVAISEEQIRRDYWEKPVEPEKTEPSETEEVANIDYSSLNYRELLKVAKEAGVYKKGMRKADLLEALS
jgi:hypothetical protein